jgi:hypothetical protein
MKKLIAIAALMCGAAHAEFLTGNDLHKWGEEAATNNLSFGMLYGYIAGAYDAGRGSVHCSPLDIRLQQVVDMVRNHIAANPALRHYSGDTIVGYVLKQAWPCAEKKKGTVL